MAIKQDENGIIHLFSGDTGHITINGLNPEINYNCYLQFSDEDGNFIGSQITSQSNYSSSVAFFVPKTVSDLLTVPAGEDYTTYYCGVKKAEVGSYDEDTIIPTYGGEKTVIVYRKVVEGPDNE
jgi:hypothetical protein